MGNYFQTDLLNDALDSMREAQFQIGVIRERPTAIKWATIALHSAVQGHMALLLHQGNGLNIMRDKDASAWLKAHYADEQYPLNGKMDSFMNLYSKIKRDDCMRTFFDSVPFCPNGHDESMRRLNDIRNRFVHFQIDGWTIETSGLHSIYSEAVDLVEFATNSVSFPWQWSDSIENHKGLVERAIVEIRADCSKPFEIRR